MLGSSTITALVGTAKPEAAKAFYGETLGLKFVAEDQFAAIFEGKNLKIRVSKTPVVVPAPYAILSFDVANMEEAVDALAAKGVTFARFGFLPQDAKGIWSAPDGTKVAWFHDPDLNLLSLVQHAS
ncbi:MAG TPA: VOC family protein [Vitreimonas sp.]|uniref:VOC family protein n=1 Tax=Vitreimonas sp. TaxID=3069702 RepID=UPI002D29D39F|nr:VOC family protein [Vitreimonas sp.]HYD88189.1 VOC family protein [Vitreimonas sp.]